MADRKFSEVVLGSPNEEIQSDPYIASRTIRVIFDDPRWNYQTEINGTREYLENYFLGRDLNVANYPKEVMKTSIAIEFVGQNIKAFLSV